MKKILLTATAFAAFSLATNAQTRMTLHEEFTGENCGPCASTNPSFWALCDLAANTSKLIHISYMTPIPSAGWLFYQDSLDEHPRRTYYSVPFAPYGRYDGHVPNPTASSPGHPGYFAQADIDAEAAIASPFTMTVTAAWHDAACTSIDVTVSGNCVAAYASAAQLRIALIQTLDFPTAPGSNGETHFENVVRKMYPNATGTAMSPTGYTVGDPYTYTFNCVVPSYVDKTKAPSMVAWIQNDADKTIAQAAQSPVLPAVTLDVASTASTPPLIVCPSSSPYTLDHTATIKNTGSTTLTSATIYYNVDGGTFSPYSWIGSLAAGEVTTVTMPTVSVAYTSNGSHYVVDSVDMPNATADINPVNNESAATFFIESNTPVSAPLMANFETTTTNDMYGRLDLNRNGQNWYIVSSGTSTPLGHGSSTYAAYHNNYGYLAGETNILTLPKVTMTSTTAVDFWVAYAQYDATTNDQLEVVYSSDCGASWTSLWSAAGSSLSTHAATTSLFIPTNADYVKKSVSLGAVATGSIIGFRATSAYGNLVFLDDINVRNVPVSVANVNGVTAEVSIYPNPAKESATLSFNLSNQSDMQIQVIDAIGRVVNTVANGKMEAGAHTLTINTSALAAGVYNVVMHSDAGTQTQRLSVAK